MFFSVLSPNPPWQLRDGRQFESQPLRSRRCRRRPRVAWAAKSSNLALRMNQEVFLSVQQEGADQKFRLAVFGCEFDRISGKMRSGTPYLVTSFDRVSPEMLDKGASIGDCEMACDRHDVVLGLRQGSDGKFQRTLYVRGGYLDLLRTDHAQPGLPLYRLSACHLRPSHCIPAHHAVRDSISDPTTGPSRFMCTPPQ
jgi:hypothetical protein